MYPRMPTNLAFCALPAATVVRRPCVVRADVLDRSHCSLASDKFKGSAGLGSARKPSGVILAAAILIRPRACLPLAVHSMVRTGS